MWKMKRGGRESVSASLGGTRRSGLEDDTGVED